jgi:Protein of unknown function (DUF2911)
MSRVTSFIVLVLCVFAIVPALGSLVAQDSSASATCNFDEDKQLVVQYQHVTVNLKKPLNMQVPFGKVWAPGGKAMTLFTNTPVQIGSKVLPTGAYTLFVIPNSKQWTLIVSKSTDTSGAYDQQQDLIRVPMESGELPSPEADFSVAFAHLAPQQCNIRIDLDKFGHFAEFFQK